MPYISMILNEPQGYVLVVELNYVFLNSCQQRCVVRLVDFTTKWSSEKKPTNRSCFATVQAVGTMSMTGRAVGPGGTLAHH